MTDGPTIHSFTGPTGRRLDSAVDQPGVIGSIGSRALASEDRLALARRHFTEMRESDFIIEGRRWQHRHSDLVYEAVGHDPLSGQDSDAGGVTAFAQAGDSIVYLRRKGWQPEEESKVMGGAVSGRAFGPPPPPPRPAAGTDVLHAPSDGKGWLVVPSSSKDD